MREIYNPKYKLNGLTQGSIISNCVLSCYPDADVSGLIITPRCDLARGIKVNTIHYLPVIPLAQWMEYEGNDFLHEHILNEVKQSLNQEIERKRKVAGDFLSTSMADRQTVEEILERPSEKQKKLINLFFGQTDCQFKEYIKEKPKTIKCLSELIDSNRIGHLYIIEDWNNADDYQVVFLREIHQITREVAMQLGSGLISDAKEESFFQTNSLACPKEGETLEYRIMAEITSPVIEHIMQHFSHHFTRIGVEDRNKINFLKYLSIAE